MIAIGALAAPLAASLVASLVASAVAPRVASSVAPAASSALLLRSNLALVAQHESSATAADYTEADFRADRELVNGALARSAELAAKSDFDGAIQALDEAIRAARPASLRATLWLTRANVHQVGGRLSAAETDLDEADGALATIDDATRSREHCRQLASYSCSQRSKLFLEWGLIDIAFRWVSRAKAALPASPAVDIPGAHPTTDFDRERILANYVEALVLSSMEDYDTLESSVATALEDGIYARFPGQRARLRARLGLALKESARTRPEVAARARSVLADALSDRGLKGFDRILPELGLAELDLRAAHWAAAEQHVAAAAELLGPVETRASLPAHSAWLALSSRLRVERTDRPASEVALVELRADLERAFADRVADWSRRELRSGGYGHLHHADQQSLVSELMRLDVALEKDAAGAERALSRLLSAGATSTLARKLGAGAVELATVRKALLGSATDHALLVYFPAPDRTHLFVVDRETTEHFALAPADVVDAALAAANRALFRPLAADAPEWQARERDLSLARLAAVLLPERAWARLRGRARWTIVGEDLLGPVPFEALKLDGAYLGTTHALARLPSLAVGVRLAERARHAASERAVELFAAPLGDGRSFGDAELLDVVAPYPAGTSRVTRGAQATRAALAERLASARVAQVLAHGSREESRERPAGMLLASPDGAQVVFVGADEIEALDAPPLTVLTVCEAGRAPKRRGDAGAADLAGALLAAGTRARCVVQSAFDLDLESARAISARFHAALAAGDAPAEALRKARAAMARDPRFADPFHHATMVAVGLAHAPLF